MSTRCRIGIKNADGTVTSMALTGEGYPEEPGAGWELLRGYTTSEQVAALVALGELPEVGATLKDSTRRRFADAADPVTHAMDAWPDSGAEYEYLFAEGVWRGRRSGFYPTDWQPISEMPPQGD